MKNDIFQKLIYQLVSKFFVFPIYKFVFQGSLIGRENIPKMDSFIMVANQFLMNVPLFNSAYAARNSSCVFITIGPRQATGSSSG